MNEKMFLLFYVSDRWDISRRKVFFGSLHRIKKDILRHGLPETADSGQAWTGRPTNTLASPRPY
jgi:hypothetical protein